MLVVCLLTSAGSNVDADEALHDFIDTHDELFDPTDGDACVPHDDGVSRLDPVAFRFDDIIPLPDDNIHVIGIDRCACGGVELIDHLKYAHIFIARTKPHQTIIQICQKFWCHFRNFVSTAHDVKMPRFVRGLVLGKPAGFIASPLNERYTA